nr:hypothetical protein [Tanacetum cinerariifolium]
MLDSDKSGVTYTEVSSPFEDLSNIGSPRADDHEHLELPRMLEDPYVEVALQASPSPDYIPSPEEPEQAPPLPDYVLGPEHADDEIADLEAYPEEDDDEDPEEDPVDYPADGGDDGDDEEGSSEDDDIDIEANEEEEEYPAPAESIVVALLATDQVLSVEETEPFEIDEKNSPEVTLPPRKRLGIALGPGYKVGKSSSAAAARPAGETLQGAPVSTDTELGRYMREFETRVRRDTNEIYSRLDDEQSEQHLLAGWLNTLFRYRRAHAYTHHLMETGARLSRVAWVRSMDASDLARGKEIDCDFRDAEGRP